MRATNFVSLSSFMFGVWTTRERERERKNEREKRRKSTISKRRWDEKLINYIDTQQRNWVNDKWEADEGRRRLLSPFVWNSSYCHRCYSYIAVIWLLVIGLVSLDRSFRQNFCVLWYLSFFCRRVAWKVIREIKLFLFSFSSNLLGRIASWFCVVCRVRIFFIRSWQI